MAAISLSG